MFFVFFLFNTDSKHMGEAQEFWVLHNHKLYKYAVVVQINKTQICHTCVV